MKRIPAMLGIIICCSSPLAGQGTGGWSLKEIMKLEPLPGAEFRSVAGLAVDRSGAIYLSDPLLYTLWKFDAHGRFLGKTGSRGDQAGQFRSPSMVIASGDTIVVMQSTNPAIQYFSQSLEPLGSCRPYDGQPVCLAADRKGRLIVGGMRAYGDRQILTRLPSLMASAGLQHAIAPGERTDDLFQACHVAVTSKGVTVIAFLFENRIVWIDEKGRALRSQSLPALGVPGAEEAAAAVPEETAFKAVVAGRRGRVYVLGGSLAPHPHRDVFVLAESGRLLGCVTLPFPSRLLAVDSAGDLYATSNEGTVVRKYRVSRRKS